MGINGDPRVVYISYDGIQEPLGESQVLGYLRRLARKFDITLISYEKSAPRADLHRELATSGIEWCPRRYHRRPPVVSTFLDVVAGVYALRRAARKPTPLAVVHVRSYVPALIAVLGRRGTRAKLVFDIRGFWADERVDAGLWRRGGVLYRIAKRCERWFFAEADAVVTLTSASVPQIRTWLDGRDVPIEVIPTCVDVRRFATQTGRPGGPHAVWSGSMSTWYRFDLAPRVAAALGRPLTVLTRETHEARTALGDFAAAVTSVPPDRMPDQLYPGDVGLCLITSTFSKIASAPTRFAEYLAAGMPVLVTSGVGDLEAMVELHRVGVVLPCDDDRAIRQATADMLELLDEPNVSERCRAVAQALFDVEAGSSTYVELYRRLIR